MNASSNTVPRSSGASAVRKKMLYVLALAVVAFISGMVMALLHVTHGIVPALSVSIGGALIGVYISTRGDTIIYDEMVIRIVVLSGYYAYIATMYFIFTLGILNFFFRLRWSVSTFLLVMMLFMSLSFIIIRAVLLKWGKAE